MYLFLYFYYNYFAFLSVTGSLDKYIKTASKESILKSANESTMGAVFIDDPQGLATIADLFVDFYNGISKSTIARGREQIRCGLMVTSNNVLEATVR